MKIKPKGSPLHQRELRGQQIDLRMGHELGSGSPLTITPLDISSVRSTHLLLFEETTLISNYIQQGVTSSL